MPLSSILPDLAWISLSNCLLSLCYPRSYKKLLNMAFAQEILLIRNAYVYLLAYLSVSLCSCVSFRLSRTQTNARMSICTFNEKSFTATHPLQTLLVPLPHSLTSPNARPIFTVTNQV